MKGVEVPAREEDFTADPVELFFDLAFVFAFSRLVYHLVHHADWAGIGEFALLFMMIWLPWSQFTWSANAVSGNTRPIRLLFLIGTVTSVPMAAAVTTAFGDGGVAFGIGVSIILLLGLSTMIFIVDVDEAVRASLIRYSIPNAVAATLIVVGSFFDRSPRIVFWIAAMLAIGVGMVRAGSSEWLVRAGHFAERHALIIIVALGEVIVALGIPVVETLEEGEGLPARTLLALIAAGAFASLLWWSYFDRLNAALEHRHLGVDDSIENGRFARDVYTTLHLPIVAGVILSAAALEEIALHPKDPLPDEFRWMLFGGLALYLGGVIATVWRAFRVIAQERVAAIVAIGTLVTVGGSISAVTLLVLVDLVLLLVLIGEQVRIEGRSGRNASESPS